MNVESGYDNPNHYKIQLANKFNNVIQVRLISTEIPNTRFTFQNYIEDSIFSNNKNQNAVFDHLYWLNKDDSVYVYNYFMISDQTLFKTVNMRDF